MRTFFWWLFVAVACTPMLLIALIAAEARYPRLDRFTLHTPSGIRSIVGEIAMISVGYGKDSGQKLDRVLRFDPENPEAWTRRCSTQRAESDQALATCSKAVALNPTEWNYNDLGLAQENHNDPCAAEDSFNVANMKALGTEAFILRSFGRAAFECGHIAGAVHNFELAERKDMQQVAVGAAEHEDEEDQADDVDSLRTDRDWLILTYARNQQPRRAAEMCSTAHPTWKTCSCSADAKGVKCVNPAMKP